MKRLVILLIILFVSENIIAQDQTGVKPVRITGKVMNSRTREPVPFAHIVNASRNTGTATGETGEFSIVTGRHDSLKFTAIGFEDKIIFLRDSSDLSLLYFSIYLEPRSYLLEEVDIYANDPMDGFRRDTTQSTRYRFSLGKDDPMTMELGAKPIASGYITAFANQFNRHERQEKKLERIFDEQHSEIQTRNRADSLAMVINARYNSLVVSRITDLQGNELDSFIKEYRPSDIFILSASEYDFALQIVTSFRDYREKHGLEVDMEEVLRRAIFKN
ncbi:MAG TPA: carboxypeptidase-like regulatory domain-containing protein [Cyclobacteriaceae bacterium]|nr:carboxypeptidase-like regulatory domain-containing protein [Cyclobacteriaceae bacterium]